MLYGREPLFSAQIQHLEVEEIDLRAGGIQKLRTQQAHRGAVLQEVVPMAMRNLVIAQQRDRNHMRNLAIAQQRDRNHYQHVRGGGYSRPKTTFSVGDFVMLKQKVTNTLGVPVRHILRVVALRGNGVAVRTHSLKSLVFL